MVVKSILKNILIPISYSKNCQNQNSHKLFPLGYGQSEKNFIHFCIDSTHRSHVFHVLYVFTTCLKNTHRTRTHGTH